MYKIVLPIVLAGALALPSLAQGQASASVQLRLDLPVVLPQLVVVSPGIRVVPEVNEEVFYTDGYYWVRQDRGWYRARDTRGGWVYVPSRRVPPGLVKMPPGKYKRWKGGPPHARPARYAPAPGPSRYAPPPARYDGRRDRGGHDHGDHGHKHKGHGRGRD